MTPGSFHHTGNVYYPTGATPQQTAYGQSAINDPNPDEVFKHKRINITRTMGTQGLKSNQHHFHSDQPATTPLPLARISTNYTHQPYFNKQPQQQPTFPTTPMLNWDFSGANWQASQYQTIHQGRYIPLTPASMPYIPVQAHQVNGNPSTNPFSSTDGSRYPEPMQWHQPLLKSMADRQDEEITEFLSKLCDSQSGAPALVKSESFVQSAPHAPPRKRPHHPDWNRHAEFGAFQRTKHSPYTMTNISDQATFTDKNLYPASHINQLEQHLATTPLYPLQSPIPKQSATTHTTTVWSSSGNRPNPLPMNTSISQPPSVSSDTLQQGMDCPGNRKTSEESQLRITAPAIKVSGANDQVDFNWQAPEFDRHSKVMMTLIRKTQNILGIYNLNLPWITPAHVFIIAADAIDGSISEITMHILRLGYLRSLPYEPDNPLEHVNPEVAKVVSNWYEQSEEDKIEAEYFELLKTINSYRKNSGKLTFKKNASYSRILKTAANILESENNFSGTRHLPPRSERADLIEYIQTALQYIHSVSSSGTTRQTPHTASGDGQIGITG
ncbi:hypothetical protein [Endozoicomonas sp. SCSIO W0465]|uniref:hypothetical protein n=1 Tax=Endozoicomonas sp. SCSIO W0465 TaxID=2918516 RepID=UPI002074F9D7|nr:hypothetical protein [Endozoicomonas sp. SCSIO W0465]USE37217.1 hypothetical protein MJO57_03015 [Endozoicomonas sp. SCSIO W0465]